MTCSKEPCSCRNPVKFEPCGDLQLCCEYCPDGSPCGYAIVSPCLYAKSGLYLRHVTPLWKMCLIGCVWRAFRCDSYTLKGSARQGVQEYLHCGEGELPNIYPGEPPAEGEHCSGTGSSMTQIMPPFCTKDFTDLVKTRLLVGCDTLSPGTYTDAFQFIRDSREYTCGYRDWYGLGEPDVNGLGEHMDDPIFVDLSAATYHEQWLEDTELVWELEVTSPTTATLTGHYGTWDSYDGSPIELKTIVYQCNNWTCVPEIVEDDDSSHGNTFEMVDYPNADHLGLPRYLCVVPYSSNWRTPCDPPSAACVCGDPGVSGFIFDLISPGCAGLDGRQVIMTRLFGPAGSAVDMFGDSYPTELTSYLTAPETAPCGWFHGQIATRNIYCEEGHKFDFVTWCDGSAYHGDVYCDEEYLGTADDDAFTMNCDGATFNLEWVDFGACCEPDCSTVYLCECDVPSTIIATFASIDCPELDGQIVSLGLATATTANPVIFAGTLATGGNCDGLSVLLKLYTDTCFWVINIRDGWVSEASPGTDCGNTDSPSMQCPLTSQVLTGVSWTGSCSSCCSGNYTVTLTP